METIPPSPRTYGHPAAEASSLAAQLRAATRAAHHRIDHHELLAPLVRSDLQRAHYIKLLHTFAWIYRTLDPAFATALRRWCPATGFQSSDRIGWLAEDLALLAPDAASPEPYQAPAIDSPAELVGRLYVIEGSTLGGQVIARQLELSLGVGPASGGRFFHGHGPATPERWQAFMAFAGHACPHADIQVACAAANSMFEELAHDLKRGFDQLSL